MRSRVDLATLRSLIASESDVAEGLDQYCVLVQDADMFGTWEDCPPRLGEPFAQDGSEHEFCLLDDGAVLLYTPLSDTPYRIVGADLREFLALLLHGNGAAIGFLGYEWDEASGDLASEDVDEELDDVELTALARLTVVFGLERWTALTARLQELQSHLPPS